MANKTFYPQESMDDILAQIKTAMDGMQPSDEAYHKLASTYNTLFATREKCRIDATKVDNDAVTQSNREKLESDRLQFEKTQAEKREIFEAEKFKHEVTQADLRNEIDRALAEEEKKENRRRHRTSVAGLVVSGLTTLAGVGAYAAIHERDRARDEAGILQTDPTGKATTSDMNRGFFSLLTRR